MIKLVAGLVWGAGVAGWYAIRFPHSLRARRAPVKHVRQRVGEIVLLAVSFSGLFTVPFLWLVAGWPRALNYPGSPCQVAAGAAVFAASLRLFALTHRDLGKNWSVMLELREQHRLVTGGVYARVRHPMYAAFWLWALAQAILLPNFAAGGAGLVGFGFLYFLRVGREERLMLEMFGDEYRAYMDRTGRLLPRWRT
ncbi:MAG TPA: protein-S-isoprenylcysteine O-methyltransferase [Lacunisphaera sp.]|nr:protein-S-isoprenylcysteine O-methyltransferase [Lacunisphaera sp.]